MILTVVTRIVTQGSVSPWSIAWVVLLAVGFVVVTTLVGLRLAPPIFAVIRRYSRSSGTLVVLALARPALRPGAFRALAAEGHVHALLVLDDSYSMGYQPEGAERETLFDRARRRAVDLIHQGLRPGDAVSVVLASDPAQLGNVAVMTAHFGPHVPLVDTPSFVSREPFVVPAFDTYTFQLPNRPAGRSGTGIPLR